ncbi:unnamed protein product [Trichogramma brassicae]|uniref:Uncharacterized protein n=1 Tax=Trichogramma brassicae TaxID=86971 RepID=A0A6H5I2Y7_9HYME|nr:unnamed protein product [Trichogramma brassicae]
MTMVEGRPMVTVIMPTLAVTPTVVRPMAVTPTMPTLTVTPTGGGEADGGDANDANVGGDGNGGEADGGDANDANVDGDANGVLRPSTDASNTTHEHEAFSIGYYIKCSFDESQSVYRSYRMTNEDQMSPAAWFVHELSSIANRLEAIYKAPKKMIITEEQQEEFEKTSTCYICNRVSSRRGQPAKYHRFQSFYIRVLIIATRRSIIARYNLKWPVSRSPCSDGSPSCGGASSTSSSSRTDLNAVVQLRPEAVNLGENPTQAQREAAAQAALPEAFKITLKKIEWCRAIENTRRSSSKESASSSSRTVQSSSSSSSSSSLNRDSSSTRSSITRSPCLEHNVYEPCAAYAAHEYTSAPCYMYAYGRSHSTTT